LPKWFRRPSEAAAPVSAPVLAVGTLEIREPWARGMAESSNGGGFLTLRNRSGSPDRLVAAASPAAERVEIHAVKVVGADIEMRPLDKGLVIPADSTVVLQPRGYHLLLLGLKAPLSPGERLPLTLTFEKAGSIGVEFAIAAPGPVGEATLLDKPQPGPRPGPQPG
jgi:copper(I)-binding protein